MNKGGNIEEVLEFAICSIVAAEVECGRAALRWVLRQDPANESAQAWLEHCAEEYGVSPRGNLNPSRPHASPLAA